MKHTPIIYIAALGGMMLLASCKGKSENGQQDDSLWVAPQQTNAILDLGVMERNDTITVRGKLYHYSYRFAPVDSLPVIVNPDGTRYHDNVVQLTVRRDSTVVLQRRFTKHSFASMVPRDELPDLALAGFSYNLNHLDDHSQLRFIATVGDPDETSGINYPVEIRISSDGTYSLHTVEDFETESLFDDLNLDPTEDMGV